MPINKGNQRIHGKRDKKKRRNYATKKTIGGIRVLAKK